MILATAGLCTLNDIEIQLESNAKGSHLLHCHVQFHKKKTAKIEVASKRK